MLYALDTEFCEDGARIELISIGLMAEDGREFYAESQEADLSKANPWVTAHVLPVLWHRQAIKTQGNLWSRDGGIGGYLSRRDIARELQCFCGESPTFIGYYCAYDWVVLCQLFGTMMALPAGWPMYCRDLRQWLDERGYTGITQPDAMVHHALSDARWIMETWKMMEQREGASIERGAI